MIDLAADSKIRAANTLRFPDSEAKPVTCQPCRKGEHIDHHRGVWRRYDGTEPVICICPSCSQHGMIYGRGEWYGPDGIDRCAVRRVAEREEWEGLWTCPCGRDYVTYRAGRSTCFVRILGAGYIYSQVEECDDCGRDLAKNYRRPEQDRLFSMKGERWNAKCR